MRYLIQLEVDSGRDKGQIVDELLRKEWPVSGEADVLMKVDRVSIHGLEEYLETSPEEIVEVEKAFEEAAPLKEGPEYKTKKPTPTKKAKKR